MLQTKNRQRVLIIQRKSLIIPLYYHQMVIYNDIIWWWCCMCYITYIIPFMCIFLGYKSYIAHQMPEWLNGRMDHGLIDVVIWIHHGCAPLLGGVKMPSQSPTMTGLTGGSLKTHPNDSTPNNKPLLWMNYHPVYLLMCLSISEMNILYKYAKITRLWCLSRSMGNVQTRHLV